MEKLIRAPLFLDIKTVGKVATFDDLDDTYQNLWLKSEGLGQADLALAQMSYAKKAALIPEFNTIVAMTLGYFKFEGGEGQFSVKILDHASEHECMKNFNLIYNQFERKKRDWYLLTYNGYRFHYPLLYKKYLIHGLSLPLSLSLLKCRPWQLRHKDFTDYWPNMNKRGLPLTLLGHTFDLLPASVVLNNERLHEEYYQGNNDLIVEQSYNNLVLLAKLFLKVHQLKLSLDEDLKLV